MQFTSLMASLHGLSSSSCLTKEIIFPSHPSTPRNVYVARKDKEWVGKVSQGGGLLCCQLDKMGQQVHVEALKNWGFRRGKNAKCEAPCLLSQLGITRTVLHETVSKASLFPIFLFWNILDTPFCQFEKQAPCTPPQSRGTWWCSAEQLPPLFKVLTFQMTDLTLRMHFSIIIQCVSWNEDDYLQKNKCIHPVTMSASK